MGPSRGSRDPGCWLGQRRTSNGGTEEQRRPGSTTGSCAAPGALTWDGARSRPPSGTPRGEQHTVREPCPDASRGRLSESRGPGQLSRRAAHRLGCVRCKSGRRPRRQLSQTRCTAGAPVLVCRLYDAWRPGALWPEQGASQSRASGRRASGVRLPRGRRARTRVRATRTAGSKLTLVKQSVNLVEHLKIKDVFSIHDTKGKTRSPHISH
ncbi:Hypothetical protein GLP15_167 [Giardia lamblia P15]|uniref:Uncharacterized protein n=1 Tax=Giardia intestinalis (strain P15) TaxID=658858 RepID=E1EY41_GIAIA|nr:Hypothetical protein GLP15_167 [Giardia lamblia P15]